MSEAWYINLYAILVGLVAGIPLATLALLLIDELWPPRERED